MSLSCVCNYDPDPGDHCWIAPNNYSTMNANKRKRCWSCGCLIEIGSIVIKFDRYKVPESDIEIRIYGEDYDSGVPLAPKYHCEECADQFWNLDALGFCCSASENQLDLLAEYLQMVEDSDE